MMEKQPVNGVSSNMNGNSKRPPSYSVETPYGFHLDLDFLKYVDDIEKGNTLKRVQRRSRPSSATPPAHNHSLPGHGRVHGPTQWRSIGSLWPKSRTTDAQHTCDRGLASYPRHPGAPYMSLTSAQMEESIRAFDEQPLGLYVRPNLLRASSLPATVLLQRRSESNDDPTSPGSSRDHLLQENGSSENVFSDSSRPAGGGGGALAGTLQRLTVALRRVGELEEEIRVIPELKAKICILQEERERLLVRLDSDPENNREETDSDPKANGRLQASADGVTDWGNGHSSGRGSSTLEDQEDDWMSRELKRLEEKVNASSVQVENEVMMSSVRDGPLLGAGQRAPTVLSKERVERQSVEALQKRLANLEQRLRESERESQTAKAFLRKQVEEGRLKDQRLDQLTSNKDIWVKMERPEVHQGAARDLNSPFSDILQGMPSKRDVTESTPKEWRVAEEGGGRQEVKVPGDVSHHVGRVRELLQEQWECLCAGQPPGRGSAEHLPPRVTSIQEELMRLVETLTSSGTEAETSALMERNGQEDEAVRSTGASHSKTTLSGPSGWEEVGNEGRSHSLEETTGSEALENTRHRDTENTAEKTEREQDLQAQPESRSETVRSAERQERTAGQTDSGGHRGGLRDPEESGKEARVDEAFITACLYLNDHMDEMGNLNDDMRQALTVVFQHWFHVAAEEDSSAHTVALYLGRVRAATPSLLHFLVNLADDNGNTGLHYSVSHSNFSIVQTLLNTGVCDVDVRNKAGYTSVMLASLAATDSPQELEVVRQLLQRGDVNLRAGQVSSSPPQTNTVKHVLGETTAGQTALHLAARHGRRLIVPHLLAAGANTNAQDIAGSTALMLTCERGHCDVAAVLLEQADCDLTLTDREGRSALAIALQASFTEMADLLKAHMAS
ncbi:KN motif and ankyrin repeat domain-containing protein 2-like isoform X2 [Clupea harengus]|uniref:KN motif and ankyrin repeat domain-containing protein 2-like isoform X2 n=1 Tax=Clupea harengus TaxID=7950 RepID=A0A6P8F7J3_CLUHA|nr:KN motif and ankyrin repeat domain-containing protein 2-like isoform X2 [Clupea harengus]